MAVYQVNRYRCLAVLVSSYRKAFRFSYQGCTGHREAAMAVYQVNRHCCLALLGGTPPRKLLQMFAVYRM
jgi:hypothetical protein